MRRALAAVLLFTAALPAAAQRTVPYGTQATPLPAAPSPALESLSALSPVPLAELPPLLPPLPALAPLRSAPETPAEPGKSASPELAAAGEIDSFILEAAELLGRPPVVERRGSRSRTQEQPGDGELSDDVRRSPRDNAGREAVIKELFAKAGATVREQDIGKGQHNLIVVKPGRTDRVIVIGAHHDKVHVGEGTIDNWTGAAMVAHLYRLLKDVPTEHTIVFMTFGREEEGLVGSDKYVDGLSQEEKRKIAAMVNLDTLAVDGTYSWKNNSDRALLDAVAKAARDGSYQLVEQRLWGGDSDSSSFRRAGILAMTLFGCSPDKIFDIIHSENDNFAQFSLPHYRNAFLLTGALVRLLDAPKPAAAAAN